MIHAEAVATNLDLSPTDCPGVLAPRGAYPDRYHREVEGRWVEYVRTVQLYYCSDCGSMVSMTGGVCLNSYVREGELARQLAEAVYSRRGAPPS